MRCATSIPITLLFLLVLIQWAVISLLLVQRYHQQEERVKSRHVGVLSTSLQREDRIKESGSISTHEKDQFLQQLPKTITTSNNQTQQFTGVSATLMLNAPQWFQRRYTVMISNVLLNTPRDWAVQIFYTPSGQSQNGFDSNPGLLRLTQVYSDRVVLTSLPQDLIQKYGMRRKLLYWTDPWMWQHIISERVFIFGGNGAC